MDKKHLYVVIASLSIIVLLLVIAIPILIFNARVYCQISVSEDISSNHPLILNADENKFILPYYENELSFLSGEKFRLVCSGDNNSFQNISEQEVEISCVSSKTFLVNQKQMFFDDLSCIKIPESIARRTGNKCLNSFTEIEIGFNTTKGFVQLIGICFDELTIDSIYSKYHLSSKIKYRKENIEQIRPKFKIDFFEDVSPNELYKIKNVTTRFEQILGSSTLATKYISENNGYYLAKGHLTARADFIYKSQQRATFYYVNVAPQWQTFNGGNWKLIEENCRNFAYDRNLDLIVYTGTYGSARLKDVNDNLQNLSLYVDSNNINKLIVPEIYWKLLYDSVSKAAVVFIGHNNPYVTSKPICNNICNIIKWITFDQESVDKGFSYCCTYNEFKKVVNNIPELFVLGILI